MIWSAVTNMLHMMYVSWVAYLLLCVLCCQVFSHQLLIQSLEDEIGAENFTYYRLHRPGALRVELHSIVGDVDMYISIEVRQHFREV